MLSSLLIMLQDMSIASSLTPAFYINLCQAHKPWSSSYSTFSSLLSFHPFLVPSFVM
jgi:hypothetical protein